MLNQETDNIIEPLKTAAMISSFATNNSKARNSLDNYESFIKNSVLPFTEGKLPLDLTKNTEELEKRRYKRFYSKGRNNELCTKSSPLSINEYLKLKGLSPIDGHIKSKLGNITSITTLRKTGNTITKNLRKLIQSGDLINDIIVNQIIII